MFALDIVERRLLTLVLHFPVELLKVGVHRVRPHDQCHVSVVERQSVCSAFVGYK